MRGPYDPLPYSALIDACERFFEYVVTIRQSSLFYHPHFVGNDSEAAADLLGCRRDAIAAVLTNLYVLSGALRSRRPVPVSQRVDFAISFTQLTVDYTQRYLPNAAVARRRLIELMSELDKEHVASGNYRSEEKRLEMKVSQIYSHSFHESLTGCVEQLDQLAKYTKLIVGEQG